MRVYTVAGRLTPGTSGDGGPATAARLDETEGVWMDGFCNLYLTDNGHSSIRKVNLTTGIITTAAGTTRGFSGDNGPATNAQIQPYGLFVDSIGNIIIADGGNDRIRKVDAVTGIIVTIAGGGSSLGDGGMATNAQLKNPQNVYGDKAGNIYIGETIGIKKVNASGIITTITGTGTWGLSGDGGPATAAQVFGPSGMLMDKSGNFFFADRGNSRIRKISPSGIITTVAGSTDGFSGDGGPATAAQLSGPISFCIDYLGNIVIGDNQNDFIRVVDAKTGIIKTIAGVGISVVGTLAEGAPAMAASIHPEFMYLDHGGNIYYSCFCSQVRKITNYNPSLNDLTNDCDKTEVPGVQQERNKAELYPNPASEELTIKTSKGAYNTFTITNSIGQVMIQQHITSTEASVPVNALPVGMYYILFKGENDVEVRRFLKE